MEAVWISQAVLEEKWGSRVPRHNKCNDPKERGKRETLQETRSDGHCYVELREPIPDNLRFFCAICYETLDGDFHLGEHLKRFNNLQKLENVKKTLLKPSPWPFNDGFRHFFYYDAAKDPVEPYGDELILEGVQQNNSLSNLKARKIGVGLMGLRLSETSTEVRRIWCEWVGKNPITRGGGVDLSDNEYSTVIFKWDYNLGLKRIDEPRFFVPFTGYCEGPDEVSYGENLVPSSSLSESEKGRLLKQHIRAFMYKCNLCFQEFNPQKDVAALVSTASKKIVCSSGNQNGEIHLFHVSCLLQWILLCEAEIHASELTRNEGRPVAEEEQIKICCPVCLCTGATGERVSTSDKGMFDGKIKLWKAVDEWLKNPEALDNASVGLTLCDEKPKERVVPLNKTISVYRVMPEN